MSRDEIWLTKVPLTILSPWITTLTYIFCKQVREMRGHEYRSPVANFIAFFATILIVLFLVKLQFSLRMEFLQRGVNTNRKESLYRAPHL